MFQSYTCCPAHTSHDWTHTSVTLQSNPVCVLSLNLDSQKLILVYNRPRSLLNTFSSPVLAYGGLQQRSDSQDANFLRYVHRLIANCASLLFCILIQSRSLHIQFLELRCSKQLPAVAGNKLNEDAERIETLMLCDITKKAVGCKWNLRAKRLQS